MIPVYNAARELHGSLESVLASGIEPDQMQIEVIDDASDESPEHIIRDLCGDRVELYRQPANVGHARNFNTCISRARGQVVHILHADDRVRPEFYSKLGLLFDTHPIIGAAFARHAIVCPDGQVQRISPLEREEAGIIDEWLPRIAAELRLQPPAIAVRRTVYERLGGFDTRLRSCGEDWEMWVRIAASYPVAFEPEVLAFYTDAADSLTKRSIRTGQNIRDVRLATKLSRKYLTDEEALAANRKASESWALWGIHWAWQAAEQRDFRTAAVQIFEALKCSQSGKVIRGGVRVARVAAPRAFELAMRRIGRG
jgi:glycosyltransferase involved in cell wall biosynthesis